MSYSSRIYQQRNAHVYDNDIKSEKASFFSHSNGQNASKGNKPSFFQTKLSIGQPNDKFEKEADSVANSVVNQQHGNKPVIQQKKISSIQRLATPMEEEKFSTNDERIRSDKEIQEKPELQTKCPECEKEGKEKMGAVQKKADSGGAASPKLSSKIEGSSGKGNTIPQITLSEMNRSFGTDFNNVNIHTDSEAVEMNKELGAQAFTHGNDIYFNTGKFNANTADGKRLLAHELTHVVQQGYAPETKRVQRKSNDLSDFFNPFNEEEEVAGSIESNGGADTGNASTGEQIVNIGTDLLNSIPGDIIPVPLSLPAWKTDFIGITLASPNATCIGNSTSAGMIPMSLCNASQFCKIPADFNFNLFFHYDIDLIPRPRPFGDANVSVSINFVPDGETKPTFSKNQSGKGIYTGPGAPLKVPFGNNFSFKTSKDGTLSVIAQMTDASSGITVTYNDNIRCTIIPCS